GATRVETPNTDRLAREGRMFTDAHSASAVCTPSRYCLLTGEYAWRVNSWGPLHPLSGLIIDPEKLTVARLLKDHGYATACIGKWHLGFRKARHDWNRPLKPGPLELGFDYYYGIPQVNSGPPFVYVENHHVVGYDPKDPFVLGEAPPTTPYPEKNMRPILGGAKAAHALYKDELIGTTLTGKAVEWIKTHAKERPDDPFFLYLATTNIHHPFTPHTRFNGTSKCGRYGDFIHELDWIVGQVLKALDELKLTDNTLVIFTSDNGGMLNAGGKDAWRAGHRMNGKLLGFKFGAWEGGHRVPFIVRWPGKVTPGSRSDQLIGNIDLPATFAAMMGHTIKAGEAPDSFNILPAVTGEPARPIRDHLIQACAHRRLALRKGKWVYVQGQGSGGFGNGLGEIAFTKQINSDVTTEGRIRKGAPPNQLYDLAADPYQTTNAHEEHPDVAQSLQAELKRHRAAKGTRAG
ncbi:MAG: sulfatase family protein, partial [Planctomycetota bacterium]